MAKDWIERRNIDFHGQANRFTEAIVADPGGYGVSLDDAALLEAEFGLFDASYRAAWSKLTRTTVAVNARNRTRKALAKRMRAIAMIVRGNPAVTMKMKLALGMTVELANPPAPPSRPDPRPWLEARLLPNDQLKITLKEGRSSRRGIPRQYAGAQIFLAPGRHYGSPRDIEQWRLLAVVSKAQTEVALPYVPAGSPVTVAARYYNTHGAGPSSNAVVVWVGEICVLPTPQSHAA